MNIKGLPATISGEHFAPATIERNHFKYKSLSSWALNLFMGCAHGCRFCYVTDTSTNKQTELLRRYGVRDAVEDWGSYVLVRPWKRAKFIASLKKAEQTHPGLLNADGNRAVFLCSTTDPYQTISNPDPELQKELNEMAKDVRRKALTAILEDSTLNVRILTRSPLARQDFDLLKKFGDRLLLGTSLPTMNDKLRELYEPGVPHSKQRLKLLTDAHKAGIHTYVAVAPVFPEVGYKGMLEVFKAVKAATPMTIFMEPVNLRLGIAKRIQERAAMPEINIEMDMSIYDGGPAWVEYAIQSLKDAERAAKVTGQFDRLHLWPDHEALGRKSVANAQDDPAGYLQWLRGYWKRVSEWPGKTQRK
jgi:DNA repair photolyase